MSHLESALGLRNGETAFPWQAELLDRFHAGIGKETSLDIPTGLGKTGVMAVWLVARSQGAPVPRRLIYIVDRRAVVDQATQEAERLARLVEDDRNLRSRLGLSQNQRLPISTLRGQHVDNREWLEDPSLPAIIVGTVDMIGSRLLFEGYGVSRKMRPYHAGFLGADTLLVLDESHLVPPFEMMLKSLVSQDSDFRGEDACAALVPGIKLLALSATGRTVEGDVLRLSERDLEHPVVKKRLEAPKRLLFPTSDGSKPLAQLLAEEAWELCDKGRKRARMLVFSTSRDVAEEAQQAVEKLARGNKKLGEQSVEIKTQLFVGARRVREREDAAKWLGDFGFLPDVESELDQSVFVFATSAGEVGIDLDADHMVCDLVAWERMVQRLGRVNRRGHGAATVHVIVEWPQADKKTQDAINKPQSERTNAERKKVDEFQAANQQVEVLIRPILALPGGDGCHLASPGAIRLLKIKAERDQYLADILAAATSLAPLRPGLTRPLVDAWSMTSLEKHTGRPLVAPWLRGWVDDKPQTALIWRRFLPAARERKRRKNNRKRLQRNSSSMLRLT